MIITLTTDFGYKDPFVGIMKGVIASIAPDTHIIDLCHGIEPQNVMGAALVLRHAVNYFPPDTIHVAVVDPGVGGARRPILLQIAGYYLIGPDNGVLSLALDKEEPERIIHLSNPDFYRHPVSRTFHGRDIFAPVAAHLSRLKSASRFGEALSRFEKLRWPPLVESPRELAGEIVYIDGFGNLCSNVDAHRLTALGATQRAKIALGSIRIDGVAPNYAAAKEGEWVAVINSWGLLEIAVNKGSAARGSRARIGDKIQVRAG